jgi:hypothetical protein
MDRQHYRWIAILATAAILPPSGWCCLVRPCCGVGPGRISPNEQPVHSCCRVQAKVACIENGRVASITARRPATPSPVRRCSCSRNVILASRELQIRSAEPNDEDFVGRDGQPYSLLWHWGMPSSQTSSLLATAVRSPPIRSGPRLHVVKCVWRC